MRWLDGCSKPSSRDCAARHDRLKKRAGWCRLAAAFAGVEPAFPDDVSHCHSASGGSGWLAARAKNAARYSVARLAAEMAPNIADEACFALSASSSASVPCRAVATMASPHEVVRGACRWSTGSLNDSRRGGWAGSWARAESLLVGWALMYKACCPAIDWA